LKCKSIIIRIQICYNYVEFRVAMSFHSNPKQIDKEKCFVSYLACPRSATQCPTSLDHSIFVSWSECFSFLTSRIQWFWKPFYRTCLHERALFGKKNKLSTRMKVTLILSIIFLIPIYKCYKSTKDHCIITSIIKNY